MPVASHNGDADVQDCGLACERHQRRVGLGDRADEAGQRRGGDKVTNDIRVAGRRQLKASGVTIGGVVLMMKVS